MAAALTYLSASALVVFSAAYSGRVIIAQLSPNNYEVNLSMSALMWSLMPIVGAFMASGMAFLLNRVNEDRWAVAGRVIGALLAGVGVPRVATYMHPWIKNMASDPILLILAGFGCGMFGYMAGRAVVDWFGKRSPDIVNSEMDKLVDKVIDRTKNKQ